MKCCKEKFLHEYFLSGNVYIKAMHQFHNIEYQEVFPNLNNIKTVVMYGLKTIVLNIYDLKVFEMCE